LERLFMLSGDEEDVPQQEKKEVKIHRKVVKKPKGVEEVSFHSEEESLQVKKESFWGKLLRSTPERGGKEYQKEAKALRAVSLGNSGQGSGVFEEKQVPISKIADVSPIRG